MNRLKLSSKLDSATSDAGDGEMDESASGPINFHPVNKTSVLTTTLDVPKKATA